MIKFNFDKIKKPEMQFAELDIKYRNHFLKNYIYAVIAFLLSTLFLILIQKYLYIIAITIIFALFCAYQYYYIYLSLTGKIVTLDYRCIKVEKGEKNILGSKNLQSCEITLETDDGNKITQIVNYSTPIKEGVTVRIYAEKDSISRINENTYTVINPVYIHVLST